MAGYDFHQLSPHDLEHLVRDLLQAEWSILLESFKSGRDDGIDLRYAQGPEQIIVQVKHYLRTGLYGLVRDLRNENSKIEKIAPTRYVIATSLPLSPKNKNTIIDALPSAPITVSDVYGQDDLNNLLRRHPLIEQAHPKLWLTSRAMLDRVLHNAEITRSDFEVHKIHQQIRRYVQTAAFQEAESRLADQSVVMVCGPPGIGKTTLANMLLYEHLSQEWQAVVIDRDVTEGSKLFQRQTKQIFYFDDFVGATLVGEGVTSNDKALLAFIALVRDDPTSRLLLTTREHLYEQARMRSERLRHAGLDADKVTLRMPSYTRRQRAQILYNHIYFSDLPNAHIHALLENNFYQNIIDHPRFNPRVIEWMASHQRIRHIQAENYCVFARKLLDDPLEIWRHAYEEELSNAARSFLLTVWSFEGKVNLERLRRSFLKLHSRRAERYHFGGAPEDFNRAPRELSGSFVNPLGNSGVEVSDPSVLDLMANIIVDAPENLVDTLLSATSFSQIESIWLSSERDSTGSMERVWRESSRDIAPVVAKLMLEERRVDYTDGTTAWYGATYERRLASIANIAARVDSGHYQDLIKPGALRVLNARCDESVDITGSVDLVFLLRKPELRKFSFYVGPLQERMFDAIRGGCGSDELREAIGLSEEVVFGGEIEALRAGYSVYSAQYFDQELRQRRSEEEFGGLIGDLTLFEETLGIDATNRIAQVEEAQNEFREEMERFDEEHEDEYRERWREARHENESIADMFDSLRIEEYE